MQVLNQILPLPNFQSPCQAWPRQVVRLLTPPLSHPTDLPEGPEDAREVL